MNQYQQYILASRYARWREDLGRREVWPEPVDRYLSFMDDHLADHHSDYYNDGWMDDRSELREAMVNMDVMPSMRAMMTAGPALHKDHIAGYNCAFVAVTSFRTLSEILYVLMCGAGVGFSVERRAIDKLPTVAEVMCNTDTVLKVKDSKLGWAGAFKQLVSLLVEGQVPKWDLSNIRPEGAILRTFGGRASGPQPLDDLFRFTVEKFKNAAGRKLTSLEIHDIICKIGQVVVVGGVRRSALISLSDITDEWMRKAKNGQWWVNDNQRALANNSAVYNRKPSADLFIDEWKSLMESKSGERGIFSSVAARAKFQEIDREWKKDVIYGTNPCGEIILRSKQFCNLTEVVIRPDDNEASLHRKVRLASVLGTLQSTLTNFRFLSSDWKHNCEEERLLGVSLTGIWDNPLTYRDEVDLRKLLSSLSDSASATNIDVAYALGVNESAAITTVKPSGTVSQLVDSASGIHPRYAPFYIRRVRGDKKDPCSQFLIDQGVPYEEDFYNPKAWVFSFPIKSPERSVSGREVSAQDQLDLWQTYRNYWTDHNPSVTISVREEEWLSTAAWVFDNFEEVGGLSFLPYDDHTYQQAPYEEITEDEYANLMSVMPEGIDWTKLGEYESDDYTTGSQELACSSGQCEI